MSIKPRKSKKSTSTPWIKPYEIHDLSDYEGFVYLITNELTNRKYVGRKYLWAKTSKKVVGRKRRVRSVKESDWQTYKSSCKELVQDINKFGLENFKFEILSFHRTRAETNYEETKQQFIRDVLYSRINGQYEYYNENILSRYFRKRIDE